MDTHENYTNITTAKLLKEAGFDWKVNHWYSRSGRLLVSTNPLDWNDSGVEDEYSAPALSVTQKWLREVHDLHIIVSPYKVGKEEKAFHWCCEVYKSFNVLGCRNYVNETPKSYEEGVEIAIRYCLENLIQIAKKS